MAFLLVFVFFGLLFRYDFNVAKQGMFRLYPTGRNSYAKGEEVFNSYGKRNNTHLLLNYGFAIENNMHEAVAVRVRFK